MPEDEVVKVHDLIRGEVEVNTKQLDDWVMVRPGGVPLYNFACVVDDVDMKITHVVRGEEHFLNGVKQRLVFEALGHECPQYAHIPLILNQKGGKLSKRDPGVKSVLEYRDLGYPPEAVFNYIALLGWGFSADRDVFTRDEMVEAFRSANVGKAGAKFDLEKLHWMCGEYIRAVERSSSASSAARRWLEPALARRRCFEQHGAWLRNVVACYQERVTVLARSSPTSSAGCSPSPSRTMPREKNLVKHADSKPSGCAATPTCSNPCAAAAAELGPSDRSAADDRRCVLPSQKDAPEFANATYATPAAIEAGDARDHRGARHQVRALRASRARGAHRHEQGPRAVRRRVPARQGRVRARGCGRPADRELPARAPRLPERSLQVEVGRRRVRPRSSITESSCIAAARRSERP